MKTKTMTVFLVILCILFSTTAIAAKQEIVVKMFSEDLFKWHKSQAEGFMEQNPDIKVTVEIVPRGADGLNDIVTLGIATGNPPDVVDNPLRVYFPWADAGYLVDLLPLMEKSLIANTSHFIPGVIKTKMYKGKLYSAPTHFDPPTTVFIGRWFDEAGLRDPWDMYNSNEWSWESGLNAAKKLTQIAPDGRVTRWGWVMAHDVDWSWQSMIISNGGYLISEDYKKAQLTSQPVIEALQWMADAYNVHRVGSFTMNWPIMAMATRGADAVERIPDDPRVQTVPIAPRVNGGRPAGIVFTDGPIIFNNGADKVKAAWAYVEWLLRPEAQRDLAMINPARIPARLDTLPSWGKIAAKGHNFPESEINRVTAMYSAIAEHSRLLPFGPHFTDMMKVVNAAIKEIMTGKAAALVKMQEIEPVVQATLTDIYGK
jgi:ABC-type glycerol-3-phosphate transport system substrate-binding protein